MRGGEGRGRKGDTQERRGRGGRGVGVGVRAGVGSGSRMRNSERGSRAPAVSQHRGSCVDRRRCMGPMTIRSRESDQVGAACNEV